MFTIIVYVELNFYSLQMFETDEEEHTWHVNKLRQQAYLKNKMLKRGIEKELREDHASLPRVLRVGLDVGYYDLLRYEQPCLEAWRTGVIVEVDPVNRLYYIKPQGYNGTHQMGDESCLFVIRQDGITYFLYARDCSYVK
jgi:hypothetical protein